VILAAFGWHGGKRLERNSVAGGHDDAAEEGA